MSVAHDSPNDVVDRLTHAIEDEGATPRLLVERAYEYRAIGDTKRAAKDLRVTHRLDPDYVPAYIAHALLALHLEDLAGAHRWVNEGLKQTAPRHQRDELYRLRAETYAIEEKWANSQTALNAMSDSARGEVEVILLTSRAHKELGQHTKRIALLQRRTTSNSAIVIEVELIDALMDSKRFHECLTRINAILDDRHFKAEWLVRRAETYAAMGDNTASRVDAQAALAELASRLERPNPDKQLYTVQARARELLQAS